MTIILPYDDRFETTGGFIKPDSEILFFSEDGKDKTAIEHCGVKSLEEFNEMRSNLWRGMSDERTTRLRLKFIEEDPRSEGYEPEIDEDKTTKLTSEELILYRRLIFENAISLENITTNFLVYVLEWAEVDPTLSSKRIKSTDERVFTKFYNFALMGWEISKAYKKSWNDTIRYYESSMTLESWNARKEDLKVGEEIATLKRAVPLAQRYKYFK